MNLRYPLLLASKSPRRKEILERAGYQFDILPSHIEETFPEDLPKNEVGEYLAQEKAKSFIGRSDAEGKLILASDTTVLIQNELLEKPADAQEAFEMLHKLSGQVHEVITGIALLHDGQITSASDTTKVFFSPIPEKLIWQYIEEHKPFDKAGAYGIQEGLGLTHIERLEGSYFTVMGLPIHKVYQLLHPFEVE